MGKYALLTMLAELTCKAKSPKQRVRNHQELVQLPQDRSKVELDLVHLEKKNPPF